MRSMYIHIDDVNELQKNIMLFVALWVRREKTLVPQRAIVENMKNEGVKDFTTVNALNALLKKGYLRKSCAISNKTTYVQLRSLC